MKPETSALTFIYHGFVEITWNIVPIWGKSKNHCLGNMTLARSKKNGKIRVWQQNIIQTIVMLAEEQTHLFLSLQL